MERAVDDGMIIFNLAGLAAKAKTALARAFTKEGVDLTPEQWLVLVVLKEKKIVHQQVLADELGKDRHTISRIIQRLERKGLIDRKFSDLDARQFNVQLSVSGAGVVEKLEPVARDLLGGIVCGLEDCELVSIRTSLKLMEINIDKIC